MKIQRSKIEVGEVHYTFTQLKVLVVYMYMCMYVWCDLVPTDPPVPFPHHGSRGKTRTSNLPIPPTFALPPGSRGKNSNHQIGRARSQRPLLVHATLPDWRFAKPDYGADGPASEEGGTT